MGIFGGHLAGWDGWRGLLVVIGRGWIFLGWGGVARLILGRWKVSDTGRRRKYYRIRDEGKSALDVERAQWRTVNGALVRLWGGQACFS